MDIILIAALTKNRVIGKKGKMPWHIPADLKRFKSLTLGHPIIMGRKTFQSIGGKPLPNRHNIVLSRQESLLATKDKNLDYADSIPEALAEASKFVTNDKKIFIVGGGQIYQEFLPEIGGGQVYQQFFPEIDDGQIYQQFLSQATHLYLTEINATIKGDTYFPKFSKDEWQITATEPHPDNDPPFTFVTYEKC